MDLGKEGYKIKGLIKKSGVTEMVEPKGRSFSDSVYKITVRCFCCGAKEVLYALEPDFIEKLLPGWISFNEVGKREDLKLLYSCPSCVDKVNDPNIEIKEVNLEREALYR